MSDTYRLSETMIDGVSIDLIPAAELGLHAAVRDGRPAPETSARWALAEIKRLRRQLYGEPIGTM